MSEQYIGQRSNQWFLQRHGMFTNSEIWKLMPASKGKGLTAKTYIEEKLWEVKDGTSKEVKAWTLDYGNEHEPIAKQMLADTLQVEIEDCEFVKHPELFYYGGSCEMEAFIYNDKRHSAEIKCAATGRSHGENLRICRAEDIVTEMKNVYPELYWQCQGHMELQNTDVCVFVAYHPSKVGTETDFALGFLPRQQEDIDLMKSQMAIAWDYYKVYATEFGVDIEDHLKNADKRLLTDKDKIQADYEEAQKGWAANTILATPDTINNNEIIIVEQVN